MSDIQKTHYTFGNDDWCGLSTYFQDFGPSRISFFRPKCFRPPSPAQVLPKPNRNDEKAKWLSSSRRDFFPHIGDVNRQIYKQSLKEFEDVKLFSTYESVWKTNDELPPLSRSTLDYRLPNVVTANVSHRLLTKIKNRNRQNRAYNTPPVLTEAMHAFQWPAQHRMKATALTRRTTKLPAVK